MTQSKWHNPWRTFVRRGPARTRADSAGLRADSSGVRPKFRLGGVRLAGGQSGGSPPDFRHFWRTPSGSERPRGGMAEVSAKKVRVSARGVRLRTNGPPRTFDGGLRHQADSLADFCPPKRSPRRKSERTPPYSGLLSALLRTFVRLSAEFCPPQRTTTQRVDIT